MLFNSLHFLIFFPIVTALYFLLPHRFRWGLLLAASCYFYLAFIPAYIFILFFLIIIDYLAGILIENAPQRRRKTYLVISLIANIGVLGLFKYYNFLNETLTSILGTIHLANAIPRLDIILPIGLSFHTFQSMSYTIEVFRGKQKAERHLGIYALYVLFYPQLVAGPIERPQNMLHQFYEPHKFDYERVLNGLKLMLWGLFKKVVIADRLAVMVNTVYNSPAQFEGLQLLLATYFFAIQIYCDFSGYSDIAIGAAQVMGFKLMNNFNRPYFSKSISEFWQRWHISLSTWFRDYVYIPLGGNRVVKSRWYFNLILVFLISGLWHGANWTFVIWGALHGFYLVCAVWTQPFRRQVAIRLQAERYPRLAKVCRALITFHLVCFAWIFFRANSLSDAYYIITHLFAGLGGELAHLAQHGATSLVAKVTTLGLGPFELIVALLAVGLMECIHLLQRRYRIREVITAFPIWVRWPVYYVGALTILLFGKFDAKQFIYFQF